jgi:hypothetical protein
MLFSIKNFLNSKAKRTSPAGTRAIMTTSPTRRCSSASTDFLTEKAVAAGKHAYLVCKAKIATSPRSSAEPVKSNSSLAFSDNTATTNTALPCLDLGEVFNIPGYAAMDKNGICAVTPAPSDLIVSHAEISPSNPTSSTTTEPSSVSGSDSDEESFCKVQKPSDTIVSEVKSPNLRERFMAKCQKLITPYLANATVEIANNGREEPDKDGDKDEVKDEEDDDEEDDDEEDNDEEDEEDEDEDEEDEKESPRSDWKTIRAISDDQIEAVARKHFETADIRVKDRGAGASNLVVFVDVCIDGFTQAYVIRIPSHGVPAHWTPEDAYMLEHEVQLVNYIRQKTTAPVPHIMDHASDCDNEFGSPYIFMTKLPGKSAYDIWFDLPYSRSDAFRNADVPSTKTEIKRVNFLRSLARELTKIQSLSFNQIGIPDISEDGKITVGPTYYWTDEEDVDAATKEPAWPTTFQYVSIPLVTHFTVSPLVHKHKKLMEYSGARDF